MRNYVVALALFLAVGALSVPNTATAQSTQSCSTKCECVSDGCGCSSGGGNGASCSASGNGCFVKKCDIEEISLHFAPDGSVIRFANLKPEILGENATPVILQISESKFSTPDWEITADGRIVARSCDGVVIKEYFDPRTAAAMRERSRSLVI